MNSDYITWFWEILNEYDTAERQKFIRFAWAQDRLPATDEEFLRNQS